MRLRSKIGTQRARAKYRAVVATRQKAWLRTSEYDDVLSSLAICVDCLDKVAECPQYWKWLVISLHNALIGAIVCHISGSAEIGALTQAHARKMLAALISTSNPYVPGKWPECKLAEPMELFKRLTEAHVRLESDVGNVVEATESERHSFKKFHDLRNQFIHFAPKGWSIKIAHLSVIASDVVGLLFKISDDPYPFRHMTLTNRRKLSASLTRINRLLSNISSTQ